jgi:hypothetical protein
MIALCETEWQKRAGAVLDDLCKDRIAKGQNITKSLQGELRYLSPAWLICVLLPLPPMLFWHLTDRASYALMCFFLGSAILVAYSFRRDLRAASPSVAAEKSKLQTWRERMLPLILVLLVAFTVFSSLSLAVVNPHDFVAPMLALMTLVPVLCIVPYMVLVTRNPLAGVVFTIILVGSIKTPIGAAIVKTFFPSHFQQAPDVDGRLIMPTPWVHPNLLVWIFYVAVAVLSVLFCLLGARRFREIYPANQR